MSLPFIGADVGVSDRLLAATLAASIVLHAVVLALKFSPFDLSALDRNGPPLEVALVNAKSKTKPTKAEILAQHNLDGGGNTDANRRAKTPLPVLPKESVSNELAVATQKVETLEKDTKELMTQLRSAAAVAPVLPNPTDVTEPPLLPSASEIMQRTLEAVRLEAQISKEMDAYAKRPKRRFVGARAEEYRFARYARKSSMAACCSRLASAPTAAWRASPSIVARARSCSTSPRRGSSSWLRLTPRFRPTSGAIPTSSTLRAPGRSVRGIR